MNFSLQDFRFLHPLRVRWSEVDMQKIVFNAHYLMLWKNYKLKVIKHPRAA
ncbi:hypothetical protein MCEMSEM18_01675 [Comamonadaceae bacterium]